jgi:hypothetical protein
VRDVAAVRGRMFDAGTVQVGCEDEGYRLTRIEVHFRNLAETPPARSSSEVPLEALMRY